MNEALAEKVAEYMKHLPYESQWRVLEFARALALSIPRGVPGKHLLRFAGLIPLADVELMRQAVEQGCEQVDTNEW